MKVRASHVQKKVFGPSIDSKLKTVVDALNGRFMGTVNEAHYDPRAMLALVKRLQAFDEVWSESPKSFFDRSPNASHFFSPVGSRLLEPLMRLLSRYRAMPSLEFGAAVDPQNNSACFWRTSWIRMDSQKNRWGHHQKHHELMLVLDILEITQVGKISALKQCEHCRRWFSARFSHQRFCPGGGCQQAFHKFNEADKKRRRDWARNNYQTRKELELGSRKAAQRKRGKR